MTSAQEKISRAQFATETRSVRVYASSSSTSIHASRSDAERRPLRISLARRVPGSLSMGVNWAAGLMRWKPHTSADGRTYSLSHLHPFRFELELQAHEKYPARTVAIRVGFGLHVFTCDLASAGPNPECYGDSREIRAFDEQRYSASLQLEALVRGLGTRKCFFA